MSKRRYGYSTNLGVMFKRYRAMGDFDLRSLAAWIGIAPATLMRIEHGRAIDAATLLKLLSWMMTTVGTGVIRKGGKP